MKQFIFIIGLALACHAHASNTSANQGHHGGGNHGALGSAAGAHGQSSQSGSSNGGSQSSGNGGIGDCDVTHYSICGKE